MNTYIEPQELLSAARVETVESFSMHIQKILIRAQTLDFESFNLSLSWSKQQTALKMQVNPKCFFCSSRDGNPYMCAAQYKHTWPCVCNKMDMTLHTQMQQYTHDFAHTHVAEHNDQYVHDLAHTNAAIHFWPQQSLLDCKEASSKPTQSNDLQVAWSTALVLGHSHLDYEIVTATAL
jgi:hypothetical protein